MALDQLWRSGIVAAMDVVLGRAATTIAKTATNVANQQGLSSGIAVVRRVSGVALEPEDNFHLPKSASENATAVHVTLMQTKARQCFRQADRPDNLIGLDAYALERFPADLGRKGIHTDALI